jgi:hypothetical protein
MYTLGKPERSQKKFFQEKQVFGEFVYICALKTGKPAAWYKRPRF